MKSSSETEIKINSLHKNEGSTKINDQQPSVLLYNLENMIKINTSFTVQSTGSTPESRPIKEYLNTGVIYLDKPPRPSSHEVVTWIKNIFEKLGVEKTGHGGTLDPMVSGVLSVYLNRATRLCTVAQHAGKEYVCICKIEGKIKQNEFEKALNFFTGNLIQRPPAISAVKRDVRMRKIYKNTFLEIKNVSEEIKTGNDDRKDVAEKSKNHKKITYALFKTSCQAGTYIRTLCQHIGLFLGSEASMAELRRIRSGTVSENNLVTMHDVLDAVHMYEKYNNETYLRRIVHPIETSLKSYKRIIVKDSAVAALCSGAKLTVSGIVMIDQNIDLNELIVCITLKGEAICLAYTLMTSIEIKILDHGFVAKTERVIMEKGIYRDSWGAKKFNWF